MNRLILPLALLLCTATAPALAGEHHQHGARMHACPMHDTTLTDAQRAEAMDKMFGMLDANKDGSISRAEFDEHHAAMRKMHGEMHGAKPNEAKPEEAKHEH
jgi:Spy/CpxP family protein refolding chaperone